MSTSDTSNQSFHHHGSHGDTEKVVHVDGTVARVDVHALGGDVDSMPEGYYKSPQFIGTVIAQALGSICAYLGWVLPANTLSLINADIGPSPDINWTATIWTMGCSIGFLLVGRLSDLYGRKWMVMGTSALGLLGCILGGTARNVGSLMASNCFNGFAAAGQYSFGIVLGELVPNKQRGPIVALIFVTSLPFAVFGPVIARTFIVNTSQGWRWSYYIGIILNGITLILYQLFYHPPTFAQLHVGRTRLQQAKLVDWVGILLYTTGCVLFLVGLSWGGANYPWTSVEVLSTLIIGIGILAAFFIYEGFFCPVQPLMPPRVFKNLGYVALIAMATVGAMVYYSLSILFPTIIETIYTTDIIRIGWQCSVVGGGILLGQLFSGFALSYVPKVKFQAIFTSIMVFTFISAMASISQNRWANTMAFGVLGCFGVGYIESIALPGVTLVWGPQDIGLASGILGSIRALGGAIAQSLYLSVLDAELVKNIPKYVAPAATGSGLPGDSLPALFKGVTAGSYAQVPGMTDSITAAVSQALVTAYTRSFRIVFLATIPFSVILVVAACFVPNMEQFLTGNVAKRLQDEVFREEHMLEKSDASSHVTEVTAASKSPTSDSSCCDSQARDCGKI